MPNPSPATLLEAVLDSWDRNNLITVNLLRALPDGVMDLTAAPGSPTIAQLFTHMHYCRMVFVEEATPELRGRCRAAAGRPSAIARRSSGGSTRARS